MSIDIGAVLERAGVIWYDDIKTMTRKVISRNKEEPLTEMEKQTIKRMWDFQGLPYNIEFLEAEESK